ncbi:MAG: MarC family protein [Nitrospirota bacterium]|jgi:multiple antibiotic resistance protein
MREFLSTLPHTFIPLFVAIDLFWLIPLFLGLTAEVDEARRKSIVAQSVLTALGASVAFVAVGEFMFGVIGITADDFKVAGGILLLIIAVNDIMGGQERTRGQQETLGVVPIGVPLIVGPAVLTTILVLTEHYGVVATLVGLVLNLALVWAGLLGATAITRLVGLKGIMALSKIMAILLAAIAVMMVRLGVEGLLGP